MSKYEIMLMIDGDLSQDEAQSSVKPLLSFFEGLENYQINIVWDDVLAYPIKKKTKVHRFVMNFSLDDSATLKKFNEKSNLNQNVLRYLVINIEKDYGYKEKINPKKIEKSKLKQEKWKKFIENKELKKSKQNFTPKE